MWRVCWKLVVVASPRVGLCWEGMVGVLRVVNRGWKPPFTKSTPSPPGRAVWRSYHETGYRIMLPGMGNKGAGQSFILEAEPKYDQVSISF